VREDALISHSVQIIVQSQSGPDKLC